MVIKSYLLIKVPYLAVNECMNLLIGGLCCSVAHMPLFLSGMALLLKSMDLWKSGWAEGRF